MSGRQGTTGPGRGVSLLPVPSLATAALARALRVRDTRRPNMPLVEAIEPFLSWFGNVLGRSPHTVRAYGYALRAFCQFATGIGCPRPADLSFREIQLYMGMLREAGASPSTVNCAVYALGTFWKFLRREDVATNNPTGDVFKLKLPARLPRDLPLVEQERLLQGLAAIQTPLGCRDHAIIATFLLTGIRLEELTRLRLDQVALAGNLLRVIGKGDKQREIPIVERLALILSVYVQHARLQLIDDADDPWLFVNGSGGRGNWRAKRPGEPMVTRSVYRIVVERTEEILGFKVHPHRLRHSFATHCRLRGGEIQEVQLLMGHAEIGTTMRYSHIKPAQRERLEELLS